MLPFEDDADRLAQLESLGELWLVGGHERYAILVEQSEEAGIGAGQAVMMSSPYLLMRDVDAENVDDEALVEEIEGKRRQFRVAYPIEPDGSGVVRVRLHAQ